MKKILIFALFSIIVLQFSSCNKDKVAAKNKTDILVLNPWIISQADFDAGFTSVTVYKKDAANNLYDASKVSLTFKKDGTITATDLAGKSITGNWSFNGDETKITLPAGLPFSDVTVETLTESNFDVLVPTFTAAVLGTTATGKLKVKMIPKF